MQPQRRQTRFIRRAIYRLKRDYGFALTFYKIDSVALNLETGTKRRTVSFQKINRAIILPERIFRSFVYDLSFIAAAKNFTSGGFFDSDDKIILIDWQDVRNYAIEVDDYIVYDGKQSQIVSVKPFVLDTAYLLKVRAIEGASMYDVANPIVIDTVTPTDAATYVLS